MRTLRLLIATLLFVLVGSAFATDFRLVLNAKPGSLDGVNTLRLHGLSFKKGDRIVEVTYGKGPEMFKVSTGLYEGGDILTKPGDAKGFAGRISNMTRTAPQGSIFGSLVNVNAPAQPVKPAATTASGVAGFLTSKAGLMLIGGLVVVIALGIVFRPKPKDTIYVPVSKRRNVDEAIKEIIDRLEQIDAKQTDLVKKPPVLRSFGKQIAGFDSRLEDIEAQIKNMSSAQGRQTESTSALERTLADLKGRIEGAERAISGLNNSNDASRQQVKELCNKVDVVEAHVRENSSRAADTIITLQKQDEEIQNMLFVLQEGQQQSGTAIKKVEADVSSIRGKADAVETITSALDARVAEVANQIRAVDAKVSEHASRSFEIPDLRPDLQRLQEALQGASEEQKRIQGKLEALASQVSGLQSKDYDASFAALAERVEGISIPSYEAELASLKGALTQLGAKTDELAKIASKPEIDLSGDFAALKEAQSRAAASLEERIAELSKRIDQREAILASLQTQVREQGETVQTGSEMLPVIAELKLSLEALGADQAKSAGSLEAVSKAIADLRAEADAKTNALVDAVKSIASSAAAPVADEQVMAALKELRAESDAKIEALHDSLAKIAAASDSRAAELENAISQTREAAAEAPKLQVIETPVAEEAAPVEEQPVEVQLEVAAEEEALEPEPEPVGTAAEVAPEGDSDSDGEADDAVASWLCAGGSAARRWSSLATQTFAIDPASEAPKPLTPTETATIDYPMGPIVVAGGRVVYGHGETLRGFWPGKNPVTVSLKNPLPVESWRMACTDKYVFCASEAGVEVVNASSWSVHTRFLGAYVDQVVTRSGWAGLKKTDSGHFIDFRDNDGSPVGQPIALPPSAGDPKTMAALDDAVFVGTSHARLIRADLAGARQLDGGAPEGAELVSLSIYKKSLLVLLRIGEHDHAFLLDCKGNVQKGLALDFKHALEHPVVIDDRLYLVNADDAKIVTINLKKMELAGEMSVPGDRVVTFAGVHSGKQHALLLTLKDADSNAGKVVLLDAADGKWATICPISHSHVEAVCANNHIVLATGCSYQNMIRVFALPAAASKAKAA